MLLGSGAWCRHGTVFCREPRRQRTITIARADVISVALPAKLHRNLPPSAIGIRAWIVADGIEMVQVVSYRIERLFFLAPVLRKVGFAPGIRSHSFKHGRRNRLELGVARADHVNDNAGGLRKLGNIFRWHNAGVIGTIREYDDDFPALILSGIFHREKQGVV